MARQKQSIKRGKKSTKGNNSTIRETRFDTEDINKTKIGIVQNNDNCYDPCLSFIENHERSIKDRASFFGSAAKQLLDWSVPFTESYNNKLLGMSWFSDGKLNACYNAVDRHLPLRGDKAALLYSDNSNNISKITYNELYEKVNEMAGVLQNMGVSKSDCVTIYLPMTPAATYAMLGCARIGAIHSVVFGGYSPESLRRRMEDSKSKVLITTEYGHRETKKILFLENAIEATKMVPWHVDIVEIDIFKNNLEVDINADINCINQNYIKTKNETCINKTETENISYSIHKYEDIKNKKIIECVPIESEHPLFYLYTSGSTGLPKGMVHFTGGYLLYSIMTLKTVFDYSSESVMLCTADVGWITGHTYTLYGPLLIGSTSIILDGSPFHPSELRIFDLIDRTKVSHLYTAPTAIRMLKKRFEEKQGLSDLATKYNLDSLRVLGTVGEPIGKEAHKWYSTIFGSKPVVDTYFQTETGGFVIAPIMGETEIIPECATIPFYGIEAIIVKEKNTDINKQLNTNKVGDKDNFIVCETGELGLLILKGAWPGMARTILNNHSRFSSAYFFPFPGYYFTGDEAYVDNKGYIWIRGRADDVLNVSGHRLSTAEIESSCCVCPGVTECAAVGVPDKLTGQCIYLFVVSDCDEQDVSKNIRLQIRKSIGAIVSIKGVIICKAIPKTRTGKIMRRLLRAILLKEQLGDISTCANIDSIEAIVDIVNI